MVSASGRFVIAFNGEIYNFGDMRRLLEAEGDARPGADTRIPRCCSRRFLLGARSGTRSKCAGMFAFALWDRTERTLILARDRLGEKPLYYGWAGDTFLFGSELAALRQHPAWIGDIDRDALALMMRFNNVPAPHSIYQRHLQAAAGKHPGIATRPERRGDDHTYWDAGRVADEGQQKSIRWHRLTKPQTTSSACSSSRSPDRWWPTCRSAHSCRAASILRPIVALMQEMASAPVKTFSIGFSEAGYDEAAHARAVAHHLGTDHRELYVSPAEARAVIPELPKIYSEPFADSSQIPTYLVAKLARQHVTVSLSGDGGDEVFCGYRRYAYAANVWPKLAKTPRALRAGAAGLIRSVKPQLLGCVAGRKITSGRRPAAQSRARHGARQPRRSLSRARLALG